MKNALVAAAVVAAPLLLAPVAAAAQAPSAPLGGRAEVFAGSELESYLRYLQTLGAVRPYPWSVRAFSPHELDRILPDSAAHPWAARYALGGGRRAGGVTVDYVPPTVTARYNTAFPFGGNDGPVWAGRGLTTAVQAGVSVRWRGASLVLAPMAFRAENAAFALRDNGERASLRYNDLLWPTWVDRPRRFGDRAYARVDPGQSTLRVDGRGVTVGASTANQSWGPGDRYPLLVGNNAPGFAHLFAGTAQPLDLFLVKLHGRAVWGRLAQSSFSPVQGSESFQRIDDPGRRRFASGLLVVAQPRGLPGLELGGARFFHSPWREGGPSAADFAKPFEALYKKNVRANGANPLDPFSDVDNQLASLFGRWVLPRSGFELFGEYYKEDHNYDLRDLVLEPDHDAGYTVGARKAFRRADGSVLGVRAEVANVELRPIAQWRTQGLSYLGPYLRQGHTQRGQLLGADLGVGSTGGSSIGVDWYTPRGRWSGTWSRTLRQNDLRRDGAGFVSPGDVPAVRALDVMHAIGAEAVLFRGAADVTAGLTGVMNFNREFVRDRFNLNAVVGVRYALGRGRDPAAGGVGDEAAARR